MSVSSNRASITSLRSKFAPPSASSRSNSAKLRDRSIVPFTRVLLTVPERPADQIAEACRDQQRTRRMLFDLTFESRLHAVEIRLAQPVRGLLHAHGHTIGYLRYPPVALNCRAAISRRCGQLP